MSKKKKADNIISSLWESATNLDFYKKAGSFPIRKALVCFFLLCIMTSFAFTLAVAPKARKRLSEFAEFVVKELPKVIIIEGKAQATPEEPVVRQFKNWTFIVDTTGKTETIDPRYRNTVMLTQDKLFLKYFNKQKVHDLPVLEKDAPITITGDGLKRHAGLIWLLVSAAFFFQGIIGIFIFRLLIIILATLPAIFAAEIFKLEMSYKEIFTVCIFAITPFLILETSLRLFYYYSQLAFVLIYLVYMCFIVYIFKTLEGKEVGEPAAENGQ